MRNGWALGTYRWRRAGAKNGKWKFYSLFSGLSHHFHVSTSWQVEIFVSEKNGAQIFFLIEKKPLRCWYFPSSKWTLPEIKSVPLEKNLLLNFRYHNYVFRFICFRKNSEPNLGMTKKEFVSIYKDQISKFCPLVLEFLIEMCSKNEYKSQSKFFHGSLN